MYLIQNDFTPISLARGPLVGLLIRMFSANKDSALTFVNEIPVETRKALKTDQIMRDIFLKSGDIETYFQCSNSPQRISYKKISYLFQVNIDVIRGQNFCTG